MALRTWLGSVAITLAAVAAAGAQNPKPAPAPAPAKPPAAAPADQSGMIAGGVVGSVSQWKGTVFAINQQSRHVVLVGPNGTQHGFVVEKRITNLDQVKKGDTVTVDYVESIGVFLRKPTDPPSTMMANKVTVQPTGKPAVTDVTVKEATANVTAVDQKTRSLTLVGPEGNTRTITVDPSVKAFSSVKVGDQVVIRYTEAVAITVSK